MGWALVLSEGGELMVLLNNHRLVTDLFRGGEVCGMD